MVAALEHGLENGVFKSSLALHRRGEYHYLASGISFGGDKTVSCPDVCYDRDNRLRSKTLSIVREVGSGLYLNKQNASDEVLSVLE